MKAFYLYEPIKTSLTYHEVFSNMADIDLYQDDGDGNTDDGYGFDDGLDDEAFGADDNLSPLRKLEKYMESDNVYTRQMVAKGLLDTLKAVGDSEEQTTAVLTAMVKLSDDSDPIVRSELMEQIGQLATYCHVNRDIFQNAIPVYILPMVVRYLDDANNQVRKTSQAALLVLLEQELVDKEHVEDQVVNVILELAGPDSLDEYRTEAVALMSKLAPLLGRDMVERVFLNRFCEMCCDPLFHVRKVCAANFGDFCSVVSQNSVERYLLAKFYFLCEDGVWGVRKACAECFMTVSCACSPDVRKSDLACVFVNLLCDQSRWVRMAAFQQLGPFISTFADSDFTGIFVEQDGTIVFKDINKEVKSEEMPADQNNSNYDHNPENESEDTIVTGLVDTEDDVAGSGDVSPISPSSDDGVTDSASTDTPNCDKDPIVVPTHEDMDIDEHISPTIDGAVMNPDKKPVESSDEQTTPDVETGLVVSDINVSLEEKRAQHYLNIESQTSSNENEVRDVDETNRKNNDNESAGSFSDRSNDNPVLNPETDRVTNAVDETVSDESSNDIPQSSTSSLDEVVCEQSINESEIMQKDTKTVEDFNSFNYWRTPIPQIDLDLNLANSIGTGSDNFNDRTGVRGEMVDLIGGLSESLPDLSICDNDTNTVMGRDGAEGMTDWSNDYNTQVTNIDSDMPAGFQNTNFMANQSETTLPVVDGVVQEFLGRFDNFDVDKAPYRNDYINLGSIDSNLLLSLLPLADLSGTNMAYIDSDFSSMSPQSLRDSLLLDDATLAQQQDIVPQSLLENYLGMIDPSRAQTVDTEITKYCAYNLPAVAYTLGRKNWHCIKNLYETLAADMQWKVRRTLAFSIHELSVILGEEITHRDLVPVFDGFLKDLDEVRIGILRHLADFLRLLRPDVRRRYLLKVREFMNLDNNRNWRFRLELAEQLVLISELFSAKEVGENLLPIALSLADDKVCEVRNKAFHLMSVMLKRLADSDCDKLDKVLVHQLTVKFAQNPRWVARKIFTQMCKAIVQEEAIDPNQFAKDFLPSLLLLINDPVPNVRITLAKTMTVFMMNEKYSALAGHPLKEKVEEGYRKLQVDRDRDVRYFSSMDSYDEITNIHMSDSFSDSWVC